MKINMGLVFNPSCHRQTHSNSIPINWMNILVGEPPYRQVKYDSLPCRSWDMHLTSIQLLNLASQLHLRPETGDSSPSKSRNFCLNSIQLPRLPSQFHPGHISPPSRSQNLHLTIILVPRFASQTYPGPASDRSMSGCISLPYRSHLASI